MKSIKLKIGVLVLICVILVSFVIGNVSIKSTRVVVKDNSSKIISMMCENKAETINALLSRIEQSVITLSDYAKDNLIDINKFQTDKNYVEQYTGELDKMILNTAKNTEGALTVYVRYNPDFTAPTSGLFYSRSSKDGEFEKLVPTDFSIYDPSDTTHVGWYYIPVQNNKPTWMSPYLNENINKKMISFVVPISVDNVSIGIVGMDIDFEVIEDIVDNTKAYDTGYSFLMDENGYFLYHKDYEMTEQLSAVDNGGLQKLDAEIHEKSSSDSLLSYKHNDIEKKLSYKTLNNGMIMALTAPTDEIDKEANSLIKKIVIISVLASLISLVISWFVIMGIVKPIKELNLVAGKIADGDLNVAVKCHSKDEIGDLADKFRRVVERLNKYILYIEETSNALYNISEGNLCINLKYDYTGEFARIKEALKMISDVFSRDIEQIKIAASQVSTGAEQVSSGAQVLSAGAAKQLNTVEKLTDLVNDMNKLASENQSSAQSAKDFTMRAGEELSQSSNQIQSMIEAMEVIAKNSDQTIEIIKTINDIAMQTNILALNAAIEAARAGEAGKGFSIVADEVKNLALKSADSAKNITELVNNTVKSIENGRMIADKTGSVIIETLTSAKQVVDIVEQIAQDSSQQAKAAENVLSSVEEISDVVHQNSSTSQESAASSEELNAQSQMMAELVGKFKTNKFSGHN